MLGTTLYWGWARKEDLGSLVYASSKEASAGGANEDNETVQGTWLEQTRRSVQPVPEYPFAIPPGGLPWYCRPSIWATSFGIVIAFISLVVLW